MTPTPPPTRDVDADRGAARAAAGVGAARLSGVARETVMAATVGVGGAGDALRVALQLPGLVQNLLGESVLSAAVTPDYTRLSTEQRHREAAQLAATAAALLAAVSGVVVAVGLAFTELLVRTVAPGVAADPQLLDLAVSLTRVTLPAVVLPVATTWCVSVLTSHQVQFRTHASPVIWNAAQVGAMAAAAAAGLGVTLVAEAAAWGVAVGAAAQLASLLPTTLRLLGGARALRAARRHVAGLAGRAAAAVAGRGALQLSALVELALASLLATGSVAALGLAQPLHMLPIALVAVPVAAAELPLLSADLRRTHARLSTAGPRVLLLVAPASVALLAASGPVVAALYQRGAFTPQDTTVVAAVAAAYAPSIPASALSRLGHAALYAAGAPGSAALSGTLRVTVALACGAALMLPLEQVSVDAAGAVSADWSWPPWPLPSGDGARLGIAGLAAGASLGAWVEWAWVRWRLRRFCGPLTVLGAAEAARIAAAATASAASVVCTARVFEHSHPMLAAPLLVLTAGAVLWTVAAASGSPTARTAVRRAAAALRR